MRSHIREGNVENIAQPDHRAQSRALDSPFEQADVRPIKFALQRQPFLRHPGLKTQFSQGLAECFFRTRAGLNVPASLLHWQALS